MTEPELQPIVLEVLDGILSGRLKHKQSDFHCGSSHCVAGWIQLLAIKKRCGIDFRHAFTENKEIKEEFRESFESCEKELNLDTSNPWYQAQAIGGLNSTEADLLFHSRSPIELLELLRDWFSAGHRIDFPVQVSTFYGDDDDSLTISTANKSFIQALIKNRVPVDIDPL